MFLNWSPGLTDIVSALLVIPLDYAIHFSCTTALVLFANTSENPLWCVWWLRVLEYVCSSHCLEMVHYFWVRVVKVIHL